MSADEIKALAQQAFVDGMANHHAGLLKTEARCKQYAAALLAYAAMVERCEEMYDKFCMKFSVNSDKAKTNPQFMKVAILLDDMFDYILKGATDERK